MRQKPPGIPHIDPRLLLLDDPAAGLTAPNLKELVANVEARAEDRAMHQFSGGRGRRPAQPRHVDP
ncbi:hypothetical protein [uncultured Caballeronia sp.]|uniref:hypothetical protein n=1 Tax=uncultured Caballeronia sp. TaxID=1827198 RepID=UPI001576A46E